MFSARITASTAPKCAVGSKPGVFNKRHLALAGQYLHHPWQHGLPALVEHLGAVQLDAIQRLCRAHHHQLYSRLPEYTPAQLAEAEQHRLIFEYWSHAAAYLPMSSYPYARVRMARIRQGQRHWFEKNARLCRYVLDRVRAEGPLKASDFNAGKGGWWDWSDEKKALEQLFHEGQLMVSHRQRFQKVFDLPERVLPAHICCQQASDSDYGKFRVRTFLQAHGVGQLAEMAYLNAADKPLIAKALTTMLASGELQYDGEDYAFADSAEPPPPVSKLRLLSPFDPLVIQRQRLKRLFAFDYQLECYLPASKRRFGYFCLPMLFADRFVGQIDLKANRPTGQLEVQQLHWQERPGKILTGALAEALADFAAFHGLNEVTRV